MDTAINLDKQLSTVDQILDLADPIFAEDSSDESVQGAVSAIRKLIDDAVATQTEKLRGALAQMLRQHSYRYVNGRCRCEACVLAENLVGGNN